RVPLVVMGSIVGVVGVDGGSKQKECGLVSNVPVADLLGSFQQPVNSMNSGVTVIGCDVPMYKVNTQAINRVALEQHTSNLNLNTIRDDMETCDMSKDAT
ncbi:hypothetical protein Tco_1050615, partial [Tanacetum coccineum]